MDKQILLDKIIEQTKRPLIIAIDGMAGTGKSTLAKWLSEKLNVEMISMDDFFLPFDLRTKQRLEESGGNIHYERFLEQVIAPLNKRKPIEYDVFDCSKGTYAGTECVLKNDFYLVEGTYSMHPIFQQYYDIAIFVENSAEEQWKRIQRREKEYASVFVEKWIPMENQYFDFFQIKNQANFLIKMVD